MIKYILPTILFALIAQIGHCGNCSSSVGKNGNPTCKQISHTNNSGSPINNQVCDCFDTFFWNATSKLCERQCLNMRTELGCTE
jgi:hypothetical protein